MDSTHSLRAGVLVVGSSLALLLTGCVAPEPAPSSAASTPSVAPTPTPSASSAPAPGTSAPPTDEAEPTHKPEPSPTPTKNPDAPLSVELLSTSYDPSTGSVSAAAMVTDRVSNEGSCTMTVSQNGVSVSAQSAGTAGPSMTYCAGLSAVLPAGSSGVWTVTIDYAEASMAGSTTGTVTIS
ncbi:hypothetical protein ACEXQB_013950 [Herbiconiux sp. P18]|uniref:hypothetical protein n=1 Tax=Herbiconiux liangxiaofengii TaxID=3342795 RepID=UPI0035B92FE7